MFDFFYRRIKYNKKNIFLILVFLFGNQTECFLGNGSCNKKWEKQLMMSIVYVGWEWNQ